MWKTEEILKLLPGQLIPRVSEPLGQGAEEPQGEPGGHDGPGKRYQLAPGSGKKASPQQNLHERGKPPGRDQTSDWDLASHLQRGNSEVRNFRKCWASTMKTLRDATQAEKPNKTKAKPGGKQDDLRTSHPLRR